MKLKIGIFGVGQIGQAINKLYKHGCYLKDKNGLYMGFPNKLDILHVCIPYGENFIRDISAEIIVHDPDMVIIHSTVAIGTTTEIQRKFNKKIIAHSPVRGVHPNLYKSLKTFVKYIGINYYHGEEVARHFKKLGMKCKIVTPPEATEAGKLWSTTQYGMMILIQKEIKKFCDEHGIDFNIVYREFNETYNQGYKKMKMRNVIRPVLKHIPGKIGGHCVIPNCKLLKSELAELIRFKNQKYNDRD